MVYDVFLSGTNEDEPALLELLAQLTSYGYKVCYHKRDFTAGQQILSNIGDAIQKSKRTICFVTRHFIAGTWSLWEFETALNLDLEHRRHRLIVIKDENLRLIDITHHSLHTYMRRYTYLERNSESFRESLIYSLPLRKIGVTRVGSMTTRPNDERAPLIT